MDLALWSLLMGWARGHGSCRRSGILLLGDVWGIRERMVRNARFHQVSSISIGSRLEKDCLVDYLDRLHVWRKASIDYLPGFHNITRRLHNPASATYRSVTWRQALDGSWPDALTIRHYTRPAPSSRAGKHFVFSTRVGNEAQSEARRFAAIVNTPDNRNMHETLFRICERIGQKRIQSNNEVRLYRAHLFFHRRHRHGYATDPTVSIEGRQLFLQVNTVDQVPRAAGVIF